MTAACSWNRRLQQSSASQKNRQADAGNDSGNENEQGRFFLVRGRIESLDINEVCSVE